MAEGSKTANLLYVPRGPAGSDQIACEIFFSSICNLPPAWPGDALYSACTSPKNAPTPPRQPLGDGKEPYSFMCGEAGVMVSGPEPRCVPSPKKGWPLPPLPGFMLLVTIGDALGGNAPLPSSDCKMGTKRETAGDENRLLPAEPMRSRDPGREPLLAGENGPPFSSSAGDGDAGFLRGK